MSTEKVSRRGYVKYAAAGVVVVAAGAAGAYYATRPKEEIPPEEKPKEKVGGTVRLITWQEYGADWVIKKCKEETGIDLKPTFLTDNDEGFAMIMAAPDQYDIHLLDNPYTLKLNKAGIIEPFPDRLVNFVEKTRFESFKRPFYTYFDDKMWAITGLWGPQAIAYNADAVPDEDVESWDVFYEDPWHGKPNPYKGYLSQMDSPLETISTTALYLGLGGPSEDRDVDPFVLDRDQLQQVREALIKSKPLLRTLWTGTSDAVNAMALGEIKIVNAFGAIVAHAINDAGVNAKLKFPKEGATYWVDNFTINKNCQDREAAYAFLEWMSDKDMSLRMSEDTSCASTNGGIGAMMSEELKAISGYEQGPGNAIVWKEIENYSDWITLFDEFKAA